MTRTNRFDCAASLSDSFHPRSGAHKAKGAPARLINRSDIRSRLLFRPTEIKRNSGQEGAAGSSSATCMAWYRRCSNFVVQKKATAADTKLEHPKTHLYLIHLRLDCICIMAHLARLIEDRSDVIHGSPLLLSRPTEITRCLGAGRTVRQATDIQRLMSEPIPHGSH